MMSAPLAGFEERRLAELKEYVAARARRRPRPRLLLAAAAAVTMMTAERCRGDDGGRRRPRVRRHHGLRRRRGRGGPGLPGHRRPDRAAARARGAGHRGLCPVRDDVPGAAGGGRRAGPPGLYHAPTTIPGEREGWQMRIDTKRFEPGQTFVWTMTVNPRGASSTSTILMRDPVAPCELVPDDRRVELDPGKAGDREGRAAGGRAGRGEDRGRTRS
ncbi:hypothetical protein ACFSTC_52215 [Nonomuraea ferruginea]